MYRRRHGASSTVQHDEVHISISQWRGSRPSFPNPQTPSDLDRAMANHLRSEAERDRRDVPGIE